MDIGQHKGEIVLTPGQNFRKPGAPPTGSPAFRIPRFQTVRINCVFSVHIQLHFYKWQKTLKRLQEAVKLIANVENLT